MPQDIGVTHTRLVQKQLNLELTMMVSLAIVQDNQFMVKYNLSSSPIY